MVQTTDLRDSDDFPHLGRLDRPLLRAILVKRKMLGLHRLELRRPRIRGLEKRFQNRVMLLLVRRTEQVSELLPQLYLHGPAQGGFELALRGLLGDGAPLSPSSKRAQLPGHSHAISRITPEGSRILGSILRERTFFKSRSSKAIDDPMPRTKYVIPSQPLSESALRSGATSEWGPRIRCSRLLPVAHGDRDRPAAGLGAHLGDHSGRRVDPVYFYPRFARRGLRRQ